MKQPTKRFISLIGGVFFIVASIVIYAQFIQPAYNDAQSIKANALSREEFLNTEKSAIRQVQTLIDTYKQQGQMQQAVSAALPASADLAGALAQVYGLAQESGVNVQDIGISSYGATGKAAYGPAARKTAQASLQKPTGTVNLNVSANGSYENFKRFISKLETNIRVFDMGTMGIQPSVSATGTAAAYHYNLSLTTYYQVSD